ncbi:MAG: metalloregulator ArsR/SmtB family transcription factor [Pseudomonadota bacterium]
MVEKNDLDGIFAALADPTRRALLARLSEGEATVSDLAQPLSMSLAGASKHIQVLERAGLVRRRREGRQHILALEARRLRRAHEWLQRYAAFWTSALDALEDALKENSDD